MATLYVKKNGTGDSKDIMGAVYKAAHGDTILVEAGTFNENIELYKGVTIRGAGKDQTIVTGKLAADTVVCSYTAGSDLITTTDTSALREGRLITGTGVQTGTRIKAITSSTQFQLSQVTTGTGAKTGITFTQTAINNGTIKAAQVTESIAITISGSSYTLGKDPLYTMAVGDKITVGAASAFVDSVTGTRTGTFSGGSPITGTATVAHDIKAWALKDMTINGFDGATSVESLCLYIQSPAAGMQHKDWMIDGVKFIAGGDGAITTSPNLLSDGGCVQNCLFMGNTFTGAEPAEVPAFSSFTLAGCEILSATTIQVPSTLGIYPGTASTGSPITGTGIPASTVVTAVSGNVITVNKTITSAVGTIISCTFTNVQFYVPNVARQMVTIGNSGSVTSCLNQKFLNNVINGSTGATISSSGNKSMFNTAVTIDSVGALVEGNLIDGNFGAGDPNALVSNYAIRARGANSIVRNNANDVRNGRGNSGYLISGAGSTDLNNATWTTNLVQPTPVPPGEPVPAKMDISQVKWFPEVKNDPVFSNEANWKQVSYIYKHTASAKRLIASFKQYDASAQANIKLTNALSGESYQLIKMIIRDASRNLVVIKRANIANAAQMDITVA